MTSPTRHSPVDLEQSLAQIGDAEILEQVIHSFLGQQDGLVQALEHAVRSGDAEQIRQRAHAIKGAISIFFAESARQTAAHIEALGASGRLDQVPGTMATLREELDRVRRALESALPTKAA